MSNAKVVAMRKCECGPNCTDPNHQTIYDFFKEDSAGQKPATKEVGQSIYKSPPIKIPTAEETPLGCWDTPAIIKRDEH